MNGVQRGSHGEELRTWGRGGCRPLESLSECVIGVLETLKGRSSGFHQDCIQLQVKESSFAA